MAVTKTLEMQHDIDPAKKILDAVGDLSQIQVFPMQVLIGAYTRESNTRTKGGIYLAEENVKEDRYQGKVGLVLKLGANCFEDESGNPIEGFKVKVGDWVWYRPSDGSSLIIRKQLCRQLRDESIRGVIPNPDVVY
jgi:co-chaperonin GroES (HSP10)